MSDNRTLILCVDRDDDIGFKGGIDSPVVGRNDCIKTAETLGLVDPEDSDVNAIFGAIRLHDTLTEKGEDVEVAVLSGNHHNFLEGDRRIAAQLERVTKETGATDCIVVTDGVEDEYVLPIIQSYLPVSSIQRIIVKQIPNLEGTYYIIKRLFDDPKFARGVLVPIGLAMLLYSVAFLLGYPEAAIIVVVGVIGIYLLFKGFGIDEIFSYLFGALYSSFQGGRFTFVSYISAILLCIVAVIMGLMGFLEWYTVDAGIFFYLISFVYGSVIWFTGAGVIASLGKIIDTYLTEKGGMGRVVVIPFFLITIGMIAYGVSIYILSINGSIEFPVTVDDAVRFVFLTVIAGLFLALLGVYVQRVMAQWYASRKKAVQKKGFRY